MQGVDLAMARVKKCLGGVSTEFLFGTHFQARTFSMTCDKKYRFNKITNDS